MGNVPPHRHSTVRPGLVQVHLQVQRETVRRVDEAARRIDQPRSAWVRMAIIEKLDRDAS